MFKVALPLACMLLAAAPQVFAQGGPPGGGPGGAGPGGGPLPAVPVPAGNPMTQAKRLLGKALFWDEQLSSTRTVACATCHIPSVGGSDPRSELNPGFDSIFGTNDDVAASPGVISSDALGRYVASPDFGIDAQVTDRKTPTMINAAYAPHLFWDGRATDQFDDPLTGSLVLASGAALESQAVGPFVSEVEMGHAGIDWSDVVTRVEASKPLALANDLSFVLSNFIADSSYPELFDVAFGTQSVTPVRIAMAIATYERSLISNQAPIDSGPGALTPIEVQGRQLFNTKGRCNACHSGPMLTDFTFKNTGVSPIFTDLGRGGVTGFPGDNGRFKVPELRNIELRAPYFHDGSAKTLEEVVDFYDRGGDFHFNQAPGVSPIGFTQAEKNALLAFLRRPLTDPRVAAETGPFRRPTLYSESILQPEVYGFGTAALSGITPRAIAVEPPLTGNPSMTVAVSDAPPVGNGVLVVDFAKGFSNVLGADVLLALSPNLQIIPAGPMQGSGPGGGYNSIALGIPTGAGVAGIEAFMQWFIFAGNVSASEGIEVTLF